MFIDVSCGFLDKIIEQHLSFFIGCRKATKGLIAFAPEIDCDQMAMGLSPDTRDIRVISDIPPRRPRFTKISKL
jgi:hypothetical protein